MSPWLCYPGLKSKSHSSLAEIEKLLHRMIVMIVGVSTLKNINIWRPFHFRPY